MNDSSSSSRRRVNPSISTHISPSGVATVTPEGKVTIRPCDDRLVTNIAFGGADMCDAWLTFSGHGTLVKTRWDEPGMPLRYNG